MKRLPALPLPAWLADMLPFERYIVPIDGPALHVMETGAGRTVLLLHGNPTWGFLWRKVAESLRGEPLRLVMPDIAGLGFSERIPAARHSLENHAGWMGQLIDALDLRDLTFVCQDWGGPIGLRALADRPDRVAGVVLLNTVIGPPKPGFKASSFHRLAHTPLVADALFRLTGFPQRFLWSVQGDKKSIRGRVSRAYAWPLQGLARNAAPLALARMVPMDHAHPSIEPLQRCQAFMESFAGPVAVVWGTRDPVLGRVIGHIERTLPQAQVTRTAAGHFLQEEVPEEIAAAIRWVSQTLPS